jgi:hypothetical protein
MDARSEELLRDMSNAKKSKLSLEIKVSQKCKTLYFKRRKNVRNGRRQQIVQMFDHLRNTYCFKGTTWSGRGHFATNIIIIEISRCRLLVANFIQRYL